jgi:tetratricopeptide (TPR) repeat protein
MKLKRSLVSLVLLAALAGAIGAAERIALEAPLLDPDTSETRALVGGMLEQAASAVDRLYSADITLSLAGSAGRPDYSLSIVASFSGETPTMVVRMKRQSDGAEAPSYPLMGAVTPETPALLARAVYLLWSSYRTYLSGGLVEPPVLVDELSTELVSPLATPLSLTTRPGSGSLVAAFATLCVEFDSTLRVIDEPGKKLRESGSYTFAGAVSSTPAGTLLLKPTTGRDLYRINPGDPEPRKVPVGSELSTMLFTALPDGNALFIDMVGRKAFRTQGRKKVELGLFSAPWASITAVAASPDGTVWVYDVLQKGIRIYTPEGAPVDSVLPLSDPAVPLSPTSLSVGTDGSFVLLSAGLLLKFSRDGKPVWRMDRIPGAEDESLPRAGSVAVDWSRGIIYLADMTGRRIVKLLDRAYCRQRGISNPMEEKLVALSGRADEEAALAERARLYESAGSLLLARSAWQKLQDLQPGSQEAAARLRALELAELRQSAADLDARARALLAELGPESARLPYSQAAQKYETILSRDPGDEKTRGAFEELKRLFSAGEQGPPQRRKPLSITEVKLPNLFPSLMQFYAANPAGSVTVRNTLAEEARDIRVSVFIPRFMDLPTPSAAVASLKPGQEVSMPVRVTLSPAVLELQEDLPVQAKVEASWSAGGSADSVATVAAVTLYRKSALTWDDTRKIASFITPNEEVVSDFAHRVITTGAAAPGFGFSGKILRAARICDAVAAYGMVYVEDPDSPISRTLGKPSAVDTVRFPRATLAGRSGDCDDTTALLASLLESAGVRTAVLTTPGHIFMAFDTGEPGENAPLFTAGALEAIPRGGETWIPVETTVIAKGFLAAWQAGSELVRKYRSGGSLEFLPVAEAWDSYPPLPLPPSTVTLVTPPASAMDRLSSATAAGLQKALYTDRLAELEAGLKGAQAAQAAKLLNQEGILHALFGRTAEAARSFTAAAAAAPASPAAYVNMANLKLLGRDTAGALEAARAGLARSPASAALNLLAARCYAATGDAARAARHFQLAEKAAPELARRYAALLGEAVGAPGQGPAVVAGAGGAESRAAEAGTASAVIWTGEE